MNPADALDYASQIEKLGIVGILALIAMLAGAAAFFFRRSLIIAHVQITTLKQMLIIVRAAADAAGVKYDFEQIAKLERELKIG